MHSLKDERYVKAQDWRCKPCTDESCDKDKPCEHILAQKGITPQLIERLKTEVQSKGPSLTNLQKDVTAKGFNTCAVEIFQSDIPYTINSPGTYCLGEDITAIGHISAITILANDVTLDLKGFRLKGEDSFIGVNLGDLINWWLFGDLPAPLLRNVHIKNGTIQDFNGPGIWAISFSQYYGEGPYEFLTFEDLNVLDCGFDSNGQPCNGINLDSLVEFTSSEIPPDPSLAQNVAFKNVAFKNCNVNNITQGGAIRVWYGQNVTLEDVKANNTVQNSDNSPSFPANTFWDNTSAYTFICNNLSMIRCQGNNTRQLDNPSFGQVAGALIFHTKGLFMKDCQFNNTFGETSGLISGVNMSNTKNAEVINCQFNDVTGGSGCFLLDGLHMSDAPEQTTNGDSLKFTNCQFNGASVQAEELPSYQLFTRSVLIITTKNVIFEGCQFSNRVLDYLANAAAAGLIFVTSYFDPADASFASVQNIVMKDCVASKMVSNFEAVGLACISEPASRNGQQANLSNVVFNNCVAQNIHSYTTNTQTAKIVGIGMHNFTDGDDDGQYASLANLTIKDCTVMDVKHFNQELSEVSAGILVESVRNPILLNNNVQACDRGILLNGEDTIVPNGFQLAETQEAAFNKEFIDLEVFVGVTAYIPDTDETLGPFRALVAEYSPPDTLPVTAVGGLASPDIEACAGPLDDLTGKIGLCRRGSCNFTGKTLNVEAAGAIATIVYQNSSEPPFIMGGPPTGTGPSVMISQDDGLTLKTAIETYPEVTLSILSFPGAQLHTFNNENGSSVTVPLENVDDVQGFESNFVLTDPTSMNDLGWKTGDAVVYISEDPDDPIPGLISGNTYYLIVYSPGYTECALVQDNKVNSCSFSGYQDNRLPTTSAFVNNMALKNGKCHSDNYKIKWPGKKPVCKGNLACYPSDCPKLYNTSLVAARKHRHDCHRCHRKKHC